MTWRQAIPGAVLLASAGLGTPALAAPDDVVVDLRNDHHGHYTDLGAESRLSRPFTVTKRNVP